MEEFKNQQNGENNEPEIETQENTNEETLMVSSRSSVKK